MKTKMVFISFLAIVGCGNSLSMPETGFLLQPRDATADSFVDSSMTAADSVMEAGNDVLNEEESDGGPANDVGSVSDSSDVPVADSVTSDSVTDTVSTFTNIAIGKTATEDSNYLPGCDSPGMVGRPASNAVDGHFCNDAMGCQMAAITANMSDSTHISSWWQVDLGMQYQVHHIAIHGYYFGARMPPSSISLEVRNDPADPWFNVMTFDPTMANSPNSISVPVGLMVRYVRIERPYNSLCAGHLIDAASCSLQLCEVEVMVASTTM